MSARALLVLLLATYSNCELKQYMNGDNYYKYVGENNQTYNTNGTDCKLITKDNQFYFVSTSGYSDKVNCARTSIENETYFPKCCPPFYSYDNHGCVLTETKIDDDLSDDYMLVKSGLQKCKVVIDNAGPFDTFGINVDRSIYLHNKTYAYGNYCFDENLDGNLVVRTCENIDVCVHGHQSCVKKCCPDGQIYKNSCSPAPEYGVRVNESIFQNGIDDFGIVISKSCRRYIVDKSHDYRVEKNGSIFVREMENLKEYTVEDTYYCVEYVDFSHKHEVLFCTIKPEPKFHVSRIALTISCICLLLTIIGCCTLQDLKCPIEKIAICYCGSLFVSFVTLTWLQFFPDQGNLCVTLGFILSFSMLAAFTWMNILSYDIWCILGTVDDDNKSRKFMWYSILGWSLPIAITTFSIVDRLGWILPGYLHPYVGETKCLIEDRKASGNYGYYFHFVVPCGVLILTNMIIVVRTIWFVLKTKKGDRKIKVGTPGDEAAVRIFNLDKERIVMVLSIFLVMEGNWLFETLSSIVDFNQTPTLQVIENVFDLINCLQGVFIFCIFMLKQKIRHAFTQKIGVYRQFSSGSSGTA